MGLLHEHPSSLCKIQDSVQNLLIFSVYTPKGTFSVLSRTCCNLITNRKVNKTYFSLHPRPSPLLSPPPVLGELRSWDQAAGDRLCLPEPNRNRRGALQPSPQAQEREGLPRPRMSRLEGQPVEGGAYHPPLGRSLSS